MGWRLHTTTTTIAARWLPAEFVKATATGGAFTLATYFMMLAVFVLEVRSFVMGSYSTYVSLDGQDTELLQISFDIDLLNIECKHLRIIAFSQDGEEPLSMISRSFFKRALDQHGKPLGPVMGEPDDEVSWTPLLKPSQQDEVEDERLRSDDALQQSSFESIIAAEDFTLVNFVTGSCKFCVSYAPEWEAISRTLNSGGERGGARRVMDASGGMRVVRPLQLNCGDLDCHRLGIRAFPTLRLYRRSDAAYMRYNQFNRSEAHVVPWLDATAKAKYQTWSSDGSPFESGCNLRGRLLVPRVPGHLEIMAGVGDQELDPRLSNVSHVVKHLSFTDPSAGRYPHKSWTRLPSDISRHLKPLDGQRYLTRHFHEAWIHDLKVVSTVGNAGAVFYQFSHHHHLASVNTTVLPQVRFHYDIEPFSIIYRRAEKRWYDFATSVLAITGGTFVFMRLASMGTQSAMEVLISPKRRSGAMDLDANIY
eukprot:NODE_5307_length_1785_cov_5.376357.p1 GENE.NODE_5307_length_1785_cov_5.376357~~NODE_5307_length_1785_cov_5.376357.p1  ORF type:complete len:515 (-),score=139.93 NODE_5307_length_1785_cov_5.376357:241-1674(-)